MFGTDKKNIKKNCVICSNNRYTSYKLCKECVRIKEHVHKWGMVSITNFIENYKPNYAPPY